MSGLDNLFEEDIQMLDALEDIDNLTDNSEDIILGAIEDRANAKAASEVHLFTNESSDVNDDGLTEEEEREVQMALLNGDDDFGLDDDDIVDLVL